ncbi:MAG: N-acetylneuraminate synthase family protein [Chloroherpetonaceae bacterium]|nr:N-acetylneuraminate synthase family protein [Chloroherpetonaceae bacterium]
MRTQHEESIAGQEAPVHSGQRTAGNDASVLLIGEVGSNHNRDLSLARHLIEVAAEAGMDAVKFQAFRAEWLYPPNCGEVMTPMGKVDFFAVLEQNQLPVEWLPELRDHAHRCGLRFLCTPFDEEAVCMLASLGVTALKIASPELTHLPLLRAAARTGLPLFCSTGVSTLADVEEAMQAIRAVNPRAQVSLLQCVSGYPTPPEQANLAVIETMRRAFGVPVGYSDHTMDCEMVPAVAVAAGAAVIEKHFTLSRDLHGPDHSFALEPAELKTMARRVREVEALPDAERMSAVQERFGAGAVRAVLGHGRKEIMPAEAEYYPCDRRSIHAIRAIAPGEVLSPDNLRILRSERNLTPGLHPRYWEVVLGARAVRSLAVGEGLQWRHLLAEGSVE